MLRHSEQRVEVVVGAVLVLLALELTAHWSVLPAGPARVSGELEERRGLLALCQHWPMTAGRQGGREQLHNRLVRPGPVRSQHC